MKAVVLPVVFMGLLAGAWADGLRDQIVKQGHLVDHAILTHDMGAFKKLMSASVTSDFRHVELGKAITFDQMVDHMKQGLAMLPKMTSVKSTLLSLNVDGDRATADMRRDMSGVNQGSDHKRHIVTFTGVTTDLYRKEGGQWKLARMTWKEMKQLIDGHELKLTPMVRHAGPG